MIQLMKILLPTDFSAPSQNAARYAASFAEAYRAQVYLLHVIEGPTPLMMSEEAGLWEENPLHREIERGVAEEMKGALSQNSGKGLEVVPLTRHGRPFEEIVGTAREMDVDLIIMGTHGRSGLSHILLGSTAERVVRNAPCPVLTVRHPEHEFVMP
jgi:nucleotide-binding universal stress UspA family protein